MKKLLVILLLFFVLGCEQKRPLPQCEGIDDSQWTNCFGAVTNADGDEYVGEWKDGKFHGQGTYTWVSEEKYVGEFKDSKKHGQGTYTWASGRFTGNKYVGEYKDGKQHGQGTFTYTGGRIVVQEWKDGKRVYPKVKIPEDIKQKDDVVSQEAIAFAKKLQRNF